MAKAQEEETSIFPKKLLVPALFVLLLMTLATSIYFFSQYKKTKELLTNPQKIDRKEIEVLVKKISRLMELPKNDEPSIATVADKDRLKNQAFFANAKNGDKVLIFAKAKKAILYRPAINKIIEVAPVDIGAGQNVVPSPQTASPTIVEKADVKTVILNGTKISGAASQMQAKLKNNFPQITVLAKGNSRGDYNETLLVDLSRKNKELVKSLSVFLSGSKIADLPQKEERPEADLLIIVGK